MDHSAEDLPPPIVVVSNGEQENNDEPDITASASSSKLKKPRKSATERMRGHSTLPQTKVEAIVQSHGDNRTLSKEAMYMLTLATEEFIKRLSQSGYGRSELDHRSTLNYKDLSSTAWHFDEFAFLQDTIPNPMGIRDALALRETKLLADADPTSLPPPRSKPLSSFGVSQKGKGKAKASTNRPTDKANGKIQLNKDRVRDNRGRWSNAGRDGVDSVDSLTPDPTYSSNGDPNYASNVASSASTPTGRIGNTSKARHRDERAWEPYPSRTTKEGSSSLMPYPSNGRPNGASGPSPASSPLWTNLPLPPPPSASTSHSRNAYNSQTLPSAQTSSVSAKCPEESNGKRPKDLEQNVRSQIYTVMSFPPRYQPQQPEQTPMQTADPSPLAQPPHTTQAEQSPTTESPPPPLGDYYSNQNPGRTIYSRHREQ